MKFKMLVFLWIFPVFSFLAQNQDSNLESVRYHYNQFSTFYNKPQDYDSIIFHEQRFKESLVFALQQDFKATMQQLHKLFKDGRHVTILSSKDEKLHFFCWDDGTGGTMRNASCIVAYAYNSSYIIANYYEQDELQKGNFNPFVTHLMQVEGQKGPIYALSSKFIGSSAYFVYSLELLTLTPYGINKDNKLILTNDSLVESLSYEVDFASSIYKDNDHKYNDYWISMNPKKQQVILPYILDNGWVTEQKIIYTFNGHYFIAK